MFDLEKFVSTVHGYYQNGDHGAVVACTDEALAQVYGEVSVPPTIEATIWLWRGMSFRSLGVANRAANCLSEALDLARAAEDAPLTARTLTALMAVQAGVPDLEQFGALQEEYRRIAAVHPEADFWDPWAAYNYAVCCEWTGDPARAAEAYEACIRVCAERSAALQVQAAARANLAGVLLELGRLDGVLPLLELAAVHLPPDQQPMVLALQARYYVQAGMADRARETLARAGQAGELDATVQAELALTLAMLHLDAGDFPQARNAAYDAVNSALRAHPAHGSVLDKAGRMLRTMAARQTEGGSEGK